jgi:hypothetical protein
MKREGKIERAIVRVYGSERECGMCERENVWCVECLCVYVIERECVKVFACQALAILLQIHP